MGFEFDPENFGAGLLAGWVSAYGVYRARHFLKELRQALTSQATSAQVSATRGADSRYISDLITLAETAHLAGGVVNLSDIVVEPRFINVPEFAAPEEDDVLHSVFHIIPKISDHPYLHAPYNIETASMEDLGHGERAIALLGLPGSGRTTALHTIILWGLGLVEFEHPTDRVQQMLDEEENALPKDERIKHIKERQRIEESARQRLAEERHEEYEDEAERARAQIPLFKRLLPVYVHLADVNVSTNEYGRTVDPAEPLVRALQYTTKRITSKVLPRYFYKRINNGEVLLLLDGFDELPTQEQRQKLAWLEVLLEQYHENFIVVTGPAQGYGNLTDVGLTPTFLRPWHDLQNNRLADNWAKAWPTISGGGRRRRGDVTVDEDLVEQVKLDNRARTPLDITLKVWKTYADNDPEAEQEEWIQTYIARHLPAKQTFSDALPHLVKAAVLNLNENFLLPNRLEQVLITEMEVKTGLTPAAPTVQAEAESIDEFTIENEFTIEDDETIEDEFTIEDDETFDLQDEDIEDLDELFESETESDAELDELFDEVEQQASPEEQPITTVLDKKEVTNISKTVARLFKDLRKSGLFVMHRGRRYQFRHPFIAAYLASHNLKDATEQELIDISVVPAWRQAMAYAAMHTPLDTAVEARLNTPADVLQNHLLEASRWLAYSDGQAPWRSAILRQLGNMLVAPSQYSLIRERITAALIGTRDRGALKIFQVAIRDTNPELRRLACLALGALGEPQMINDLLPLLDDEEADVQLAAGLALGAIGTKDALEAMVDALTTGSEQLRQAVAEAFAAIPEEGYPVLYDAINHPEMELRRAAVWGLRRVKTKWALVSLYRASIEDQQWYVRSAAQTAFQEMGSAQTNAPVAYPAIDEIPWLMKWIEESGEEITEDQSIEDIFFKLLNEGDSEMRNLCVMALGQLGLVGASSNLYTALRDEEIKTRDTAHRALADLQAQMGRSLPSPI